MRAALALAGAVTLAGCDNSASQSPEPSAAVQGVTSSGGDSPARNLTATELAEIERNTTIASRFERPTDRGTFSTRFVPAFTGSYADADGNGFAYEVARTGTDLRAYAGTLPGTAAGDLPKTGTAAFSGVYYKERAGDLAGRIGEDRVIGAFHGADDTSAFSGGIYAAR